MVHVVRVMGGLYRGGRQLQIKGPRTVNQEFGSESQTQIVLETRMPCVSIFEGLLVHF